MLLDLPSISQFHQCCICNEHRDENGLCLDWNLPELWHNNIHSEKTETQDPQLITAVPCSENWLDSVLLDGSHIVMFDLAPQAKVNILSICVDHNILISILQVPLDLLLSLFEQLKCICSLLWFPSVSAHLQELPQIVRLNPLSQPVYHANGL